MSDQAPLANALRAHRQATERLWLEAVEYFASLKRREFDTGEKAYVPRNLYDSLSILDMGNLEDLLSVLDLDREPLR